MGDGFTAHPVDDDWRLARRRAGAIVVDNESSDSVASAGIDDVRHRDWLLLERDGVAMVVAVEDGIADGGIVVTDLGRVFEDDGGFGFVASIPADNGSTALEIEGHVSQRYLRFFEQLLGSIIAHRGTDPDGGMAVRNGRIVLIECDIAQRDGRRSREEFKIVAG